VVSFTEQITKTILITGFAGLIGFEAVRFFSQKGFEVISIGNDARKAFFREEASTLWNKGLLMKEYPGSRRIMRITVIYK
jgi:CDP-paratose 2-epimerase